MTKNTCTPQRIYGGYEQTLFLGCSVLSYTAQAGWGDQISELTVEIVEDPCSAEKIHYSNYARETFTGPDPGFTEPNIGGPAFFKVADFEFAGLIQSYDQKEGPDGYPLYSVKLVDPRVILGKVQLIVGNYEGAVGEMHNLINVFGYLESLSSDCPALVVEDMVFGAPAGGFGYSSRTDRGIPWNNVRNALSVLIGRANGSPNTSYSMGGVFFRGGGNGGYGEIDTGGTSARYIVDLSEIPEAPTHYRIQGPVISLMDLITQVCQDAGCDYYVELLPTNGYLVIKVRVLVRNNQPAIGTITEFINDNKIGSSNGYGILTDAVGRELRSEVNNAFLVGSRQRNYYEEDDYTNLTPYWGKDIEGNLIESNWDGVDWAVKLDFRRINLALNTAVPQDFGWVGELEIRHALGDFQTWINLLTSRGHHPTALKRYVVDTLQFGPHNINGAVRAAAGGQMVINDAAIGAPDGAGNLANQAEADVKTLYNWLNAYAGDFYGKQYLIASPWVCYDTDSESGKRIWTNLPSTEGGWSEQADVLGITNPSIVADFFKDEKGMWQPILKYSALANINTEDLNAEDWMRQTLGPTWVKGSISDKWIIGSPLITASDSVACGHVTIGSPVFLNSPVPNAHAKLILFKSGVADQAFANAADIDKQLGGRGTTVAAVSKRAVAPYQGGLPIVSNVATYGPWQAVGKAPGTVKAEVDEGLAPWEYGGAYWMNQAGITKVQESVTKMQYTERGQITIPGYPDVCIGAALDSDPNRYANRNLSTAFIYGNDYNYIRIGTYKGGASISNINVTVSPQGVTTSYTINTFTPVFGRFYKGNADRIKQIGLNRLKNERDNRARSSIKAMLMTAQMRARGQAIKQLNKGDDDANSPGIYIAGKLNAEDNKRKMCVIPDSHTLPYYEDYTNTSIMSIDGFFRPVSKYGDAGLPQTNENNNANPAMPTQSEAPPPPPKDYVGLNTRQLYLDYLADKNSASTFFDDDRVNSSTSGHDIEAVARYTIAGLTGTGPGSHPSGQATICMHPIGLDGDVNTGLYYSDYRHMALRGPLMIQGWGYDINGHPIPNAAKDNDTPGEFHDDYTELEDKFATNWLSDATTWPVAPVDLRFDRKRGVWTTPPAFRMYQVQAKADIAAGADGDCTVLKDKTDLYDEDGVIINTPEVSVENFFPFMIHEDDKFLAYYDTRACKYWAVSPSGGGGGGGGGGCEGGATVDLNLVNCVECVGDTLNITYTQLEFTDGCLTAYTPDASDGC